MVQKSMQYRITGTAPLLMCNGQLANPLNEYARAMKKVSSKRAKTEADYIELARLEFMGGLYLENGRPVIPGEVIEAMLIKAAAKEKLGNVFRAVVFCEGRFPLEYEGPKNPVEMWADEMFRLTTGVRIGRSTVMRTRPRFPKWELEFPISYVHGEIDPDAIDRALDRGGKLVGIGDWRPRYGRFDTKKIRHGAVV